MQALLNQIKKHVAGMIAQVPQPRIGIVSSVDPVSHTVKVLLQPENLETGWLECGALTVGVASIVAMPQQGQQVVVVPNSGSADDGMVVAGLWGGSSQPPISAVTMKQAQPGEVMITCPGGAYIHITGGKIYLGGVQIVVNGPLQVNGTIAATGNITGANVLTMAGTELAGHVHQNGGGTGNSGPPVAGT
jgi:phage baseplate assembly protein gpV